MVVDMVEAQGMAEERAQEQGQALELELVELEVEPFAAADTVAS